MRKDSILYNIGKEEVEIAASESETKAEFVKKLGYISTGGGAFRMAQKLIAKFDIDISHFTRTKYKTVKKICPVCNEEFETKSGIKKEKKVCSRACANTHFRSGKNHVNYKDDSTRAYVRICWENHKKECIVCGEKNIVAVHHYDLNHDNNDPANLIPLCPTHHQYAHTKKLLILVIDKIEKFIDGFKDKQV